MSYFEIELSQVGRGLDEILLELQAKAQAMDKALPRIGERLLEAAEGPLETERTLDEIAALLTGQLV